MTCVNGLVEGGGGMGFGGEVIMILCKEEARVILLSLSSPILNFPRAHTSMLFLYIEEALSELQWRTLLLKGVRKMLVDV